MIKTIRKGDCGLEVKVAQGLTGYKDYDGIFSKEFDEFIRLYQFENDLSSDGIIGKNTWAKIGDNAPVCSLKKNTNKNAIKALQILLNLEETGNFTTALKKSVVAYQSSAGLKADGAAGPLTFSSLILNYGEPEVSPTKPVRPVNYKQYDSKWGKVVYTKNNTYNKKQTIKNSGCGITCSAMIIATWWDKTITPKDTAADSVAHGYRTTNSGTAWGYFKHVAKTYGASKFVQTSSFTTAQKCLAAGGYVVVSFGPGTKGKAGYQRWAKNGHYCVIWKDDGKYLYINDPASSKSSRAKGTYSEVKNCAKQYFCFYK